MASELGNQLLARVQEEMARNIATIKQQLIEWLERPESGGMDALCHNMAEISGGLSLIQQEKAVALAEAIISGIDTLNQYASQHGANESFAENGAEIASGLLVLADYIERLEHIDDSNEQSVTQAAETIRRLQNADANRTKVSVRPFINQETCQSLAAEVEHAIEVSRNQIEQYIRNSDTVFNIETLIRQNDNLIHIFDILNLKAPQLLLKWINQTLGGKLSYAQWIDVAEAMILVQESLKNLQRDQTAEPLADYADAVRWQTAHSRRLEIKKLVRKTGVLGKDFFESLRKEVLHAETVKQEQPWREAARQLMQYGAAADLADLKEVAVPLQRLALLFAEFDGQNNQKLAETYVPVVDALVGLEYLFDNLAEAGKVSSQDVAFLSESVDNLEKICPPGAQATALFAELANSAPQDVEGQTENTGDVQQFKEALGIGLEALADDFSVLEVLGVEAMEAQEEAGSEEEGEQEPEETMPVSLSGHDMSSLSPQAAVGVSSPSEADASVFAAQTGVTGAAVVPTRTPAAATDAEGYARDDEPGGTDSRTPVPQAGTVGDSTMAAGRYHEASEPADSIPCAENETSANREAVPDMAGIAYFSDKSLSELERLDVPTEKMNFMGSHADAVMDEEIREFFNEELGEIVATMNDAYPQWKENPEAGSLTTDIRRAFHTLKGSGRTVGYEALGEFAWQHEQLLNRIIEKDFSANSLVRDTVGDAISLLNILQAQDEFVEHKGALLQQALVAERVRLSLLDAPESEQQTLDALSRRLRLSDDRPGTAAEAVDATVGVPESSQGDDDWVAFADISLSDETAADSAAIAPANEGTDTGMHESSAISLAEDVPVSGSAASGHEPPAASLADAESGSGTAAEEQTAADTAATEDFSGQESYDKALRTLQRGLRMGEPDADMRAALAETIRRQWQQNSADDPTLREAMTQSLLASFKQENSVQAQWVADILAQASAVGSDAMPVQSGTPSLSISGEPGQSTPEGISDQAYHRMLGTLRRGLAAGADEDMQAVLSDSISRQWLQQGIPADGETRDDIIRHLKAALASEGVVDEAVLDTMLANVPHHVPSVLPEGVHQDSYGVMMEALRASLDNASSAEVQEALATAIGNQWQNQSSLQDSAIRAAVAEQMAAVLGGAGHDSTALVEAVLNRAAEKARQELEGVTAADYDNLLQTLRGSIAGAQQDPAVAEALAASIGARWQESHSLYDGETRAAMAARISAALGDGTDSDTVAAILDRAAEKAAGSAPLPETFSPEVYNRLLGMLRRGLQDDDADTRAALAATLQRHWQQQALPQDPAAVAAVQRHLSESLAAQGFAPEQIEQVFNEAGLPASSSAGEVPVDTAQEFVDVTAEVADEAHSGFVDAAAGAAEAEFVDVVGAGQDTEHYPEKTHDSIGNSEDGFIDTARVPGDHPPLAGDVVDVPVSFADDRGGKPPTIGGAIPLGEFSNVLSSVPRRANPAERLSQELASLAQHPGLEDAIHQEKSGEGSTAVNRAGFLRAVDQFETLSRLADKSETPEIVDDLIDAVYDIEDSIDSDSAPSWVWRLLDSIEQLLLTHKHEGAPISFGCAAVLRQSAGLIENFDEEANEDDAIEAINSLMNTRRGMGGSDRSGGAVLMPYSGDPLGSELVEDPNANTMLAETFIDEAMSLFAHSQEEAERWDENRSQLSRLDSIRRDMHTLKGSARMAGYNAIGDLTHGVESLIDGIVNGQVEASSKATAILVGAMWQGMLMLDSVRDGYLPQTDPYILNNIHSYLNQPLPYPDVAEAAEAARQAQQQEAREVQERAASTPPQELVVEEVPIATDFDDNIDPVLVDIFTDEAQELLQTTSQLLEDDFSKKEVVEELQRTMHTLKGGARLVGFTAIGDTAHLMESVIDKVPELAESKVRQAKTLLHFGLDAHYDMLDSVLRHEMPQPALEVNESLKAFSEKGVYRVPSQKAADSSEGAPETESIDSPPTPEHNADDAPQTLAAEEAPAQSNAPVVENGAADAPGVDDSSTQQSEQAANAASAAPQEKIVEKTVEKTIEKEVEKEKGFDGKPQGVESVVEYGGEQPEKKDGEKADTAKKDDKETAGGDLPRYVRVDAQLLDEMIAMTGETAIMRSRMENVISEAEFNLNELTRVATRIAEQMRRLDSETEAQMLYRREQQGEDDTHFDPLEMDRFSEIQQLSRQLSEAIDDLKNLQDTLSQDNIILRNLSTQQGIIQRSIQDHLLTTQLMRFDVHEARLRRLVKQTAKSVGKEVNFVLEGGDVEVERRLLEDILPALEHMIRNSLAHGIEKPEARLAAGKAETGTVKLAVSVHAAELSVDLIDDGQGLNYERIREKAAAKGLLDPERADDEGYLGTLILRSGFSTAESLSQLAGRGVGMDVVNEMVKQRRGQIGVYSLRGKGTQFTLSMPFSMSIAEVLLVEIAGQTFAAPMSSIAAISQVDRDSLQRSFDGETIYQHYNDQDYRQYILGAYFKPEQYNFTLEEQSAPALFIDAGSEAVAFHVDRILNRLEIIVKNVNRQVLNIPGISGATILGDGRVVPVLELLDLSRRIANLTPVHDEVPVAEEARMPNVLVVDDSVTMRKVSTRLLERHHYNVATAKDGLDAIEVLAGFNPDIILLDIEMPRMDGFEFAGHVRHNSNVPDVPIVMITSRTGDKHRERADSIGVQGYLGKPYSEEVLIQTLEHLLKRRGELS